MDCCAPDVSGNPKRSMPNSRSLSKSKGSTSNTNPAPMMAADVQHAQLKAA